MTITNFHAVSQSASRTVTFRVSTSLDFLDFLDFVLIFEKWSWCLDIVLIYCKIWPMSWYFLPLVIKMSIKGFWINFSISRHLQAFGNEFLKISPATLGYWKISLPGCPSHTIQGVPKFRPPLSRKTGSTLGETDYCAQKYNQFKKSLHNIMQYDSN